MPPTTIDHVAAPAEGSPVQESALPASAVIMDLDREVRAAVPSTVGVSLTAEHEGLVQTAATSVPEVAVLDALGYLDDERRLIRPERGVGAVLSVPVTEDGRIVGSLTVYAADPDAFEGRVPVLEGLCRRMAPQVARTTTLTETERLSAALTPERDRDQNAIDWAITRLAPALGTDTAATSDRFRRAATRAGVSDSALAYAVVDFFDD